MVASSRLHTEDTVVWHYQEINNSFQKSSYWGTRKTNDLDFEDQLVSRTTRKTFTIDKVCPVVSSNSHNAKPTIR